VVPEGAQARHLHGQPGRQHALELIRRKEKGTRGLFVLFFFSLIVALARMHGRVFL